MPCGSTGTSTSSKVSHDVAPWRTAACKGAKGVVEMAAGEAKRLGVSAGDKLTLQ